MWGLKRQKIALRNWLLLFILLGGQACTGSQPSPPDDGSLPQENPTTTAAEISNPSSSMVPAREQSQSGYPKIANLWGMYDRTIKPDVYAGFNLFIPYPSSITTAQIQAVRALNPEILILHNQYATKGRPEFDPVFQEWWDSQPGNPGYLCFLRDHQGNILLVDVWNHPMVNMTRSECRQAMVQKNINDFVASNTPEHLYDGIYWDLVFGWITWLGDDIDSNGDGNPDQPDALNKAYQEGVIDFLTQIRASLPDVILAGNEASLDYSNWMDGRLYEWQLSSLLDGADYLTWDEVIAGYREWTVQAKNRHMTIIQSAPAAAFADKYTGSNLEKIPPEILAEAEASYPRMRYGLTSALMGDGYYSFDFGPMIHGFPWWYDEYGAPINDAHSTLPPRGYLGQPTGDPVILGDTAGVWMRPFEHGLVAVNSTRDAVTRNLPETYCKIKGSQAPLFTAVVDDDQAVFNGIWETQQASLDQYGMTVHRSGQQGNAAASYIPQLAYAGDYEVFVWNSSAANAKPAASIRIHHAEGDQIVQRDSVSTNVGWQSLGIFPFTAGNSGMVEIRSDGPQSVTVDAVKWESIARYNNGAQVQQITLQPQDGIILISCN